MSSDCDVVKGFWPQLGVPVSVNQTDCCFTEQRGQRSIMCQQGRVTTLYLTGLSGTIPKEIGLLSQLDFLGLYNGNMTGSVPVEIGNLTKLTWLQLSSNQLSGILPQEIGNLVLLRTLRLDNNSFTGSLPLSISRLKQLEAINLQYNRLTGTIPAEIGTLSKLTVLDLHNNTLSGSIPSEIGNLTQLQQLDLSNNTLSGIIPPELAKLTQLRVLALGRNPDLKGPIPNELLDLKFLPGNCELGDLCSVNGTIRPKGCGETVFCPANPLTVKPAETLSSGAVIGICGGLALLIAAVVIGIYYYRAHKGTEIKHPIIVEHSLQKQPERPHSDTLESNGSTLIREPTMFLPGSEHDMEPVAYLPGSDEQFISVQQSIDNYASERLASESGQQSPISLKTVSVG